MQIGGAFFDRDLSPVYLLLQLRGFLAHAAHGFFLAVDQHAAQALLLGIEQHQHAVDALGDLRRRLQGDLVVLARHGLEHGEVAEQQRILGLGEVQVTVVPEATHGAEDGADTGDDQGDGVTFFAHCGLSGGSTSEFGGVG